MVGQRLGPTLPQHRALSLQVDHHLSSLPLNVNGTSQFRFTGVRAGAEAFFLRDAHN